MCLLADHRSCADVDVVAAVGGEGVDAVVVVAAAVAAV